MKLKTILAAVALTAVSVTTAAASTVSFNGDRYTVSTITGDASGNATLLRRQVWFGDDSAAVSFARSVGLSFGGPSGPIFATRLDSITSQFDGVVVTGNGSIFTDTPITGSTDDTNTFAVANLAPVPLPAGGLLLLSGLAGAALLRRKKRAV